MNNIQDIKISCPVCSRNLKKGLSTWHFICNGCGYEFGDFDPAINLEVTHQKIDEASRMTGLQSLRMKNFRTLVKLLKSLWPASGGRLLDVGAAHGWFLEVAKSHFSVLGIEPDKQIYEFGSVAGNPMRFGLFPNVLAEDEIFDVIVFNDVIEHIPNVKEILSECRHHLAPGGILLLNLPSSDGFLYRLGKLFFYMGMRLPFERLWQKGFPSPHVHYFNRRNINILLNDFNFKPITSGSLPSIIFRGLYTRIFHAESSGYFLRFLIFISIGMLIPLLRVLPSDIIYVISRRD